MLDAGFEEKLLISQDAGWYRPGEPGGGAIRGYHYLADRFLPLLKQSGIPEAIIGHLMVYNPAAALGIPSAGQTVGKPAIDSLQG